jgi:hypothetical protein
VLVGFQRTKSWNVVVSSFALLVCSSLRCGSSTLTQKFTHRTTGLAETGTLTIDPSPDLVGYDYSLRDDNRNGRTLQYFSSTANTRMRLGGPDDDYFPAFETFFNYYGAFDYADQIVTAALEGRDTNLARGDFNLEAALAGFDAREGKEYTGSFASPQRLM